MSQKFLAVPLSDAIRLRAVCPQCSKATEIPLAKVDQNCSFCPFCEKKYAKENTSGFFGNLGSSMNHLIKTGVFELLVPLKEND